MNCVQAAVNEANREEHGGNGYHLKMIMLGGVEILANVIAVTGNTLHCYLVRPETNADEEEVFINIDHVFMVTIDW